jgi:zinc protease
MKKLFFGVMAVIAMMLCPNNVAAQAPQMQQVPQCPIDSAVRVGKLDNGLTYYIRHNEKPKGQADFFIAQKVGSILEEDNQRGLAHFLEHMCFNGTTNFPGNSLIDWLGTVGVKFGYNLNAYTGTDETVYNISSVPVDRTGVQDSCLLILHDWANSLLLDPKEIDSERGVIHQEWRRSMVGQMRIIENALPVMYPNCKYGVRLPIGTMDVVDNFEPQALRDYYHKWYRPDNQAIIVVGDIDPDYIEAKIKSLFGSIKMPENPAVRTYEQVSDTPGTIYAIGTDKEMAYPYASLMFKQSERFVPDELKNTQVYYAVHYVTDMIERMLNQRLSDMSKKPDAEFAQASVSLGDYFFAMTKDAVSLDVVGKGDDIRPALKAAYRELLRAVRGGFTASEYERAKAQYVASMEQQYDEREARNNTSYCKEYAGNFTKNEPIPGIEYELALAKQFAEMLPVDAINMTAAELIQGQDNRVFLGMFPENETYHVPTEAEVAEVISGVEAENIEAYTEDVKTEPLIPNLPKAVKGKVSQNKQWGATEVNYPNGAKVFIKSTKFKEGEIIFSADAKGGIANMDITAPTAQFLQYAISTRGLGSYTDSDLRKYLQGKQTRLGSSYDDYLRSLTGSTTNKNVQTLMELIYMSFTDQNLNAEDFAGMQNRLVAMLANQESTPDYLFGKGLQNNLYAAAAQQQISSESVKAASLDESNAVIKQLYSNPADFTFTFVGDIDIDTFLPLVNQYIGSLKAPRIASIKYAPVADWEVRNGNSTEQDKMEMQTPQTYVAILSTAKMPYTYTNRTLASMAGQVLTKRLLAKIREEMGAVYSISASAYLERLGDKNFTLVSNFPMKPEMKDEVLSEIHKMYFDMAENISDDELNPVKEFMVKSVKESLERNDGWCSAINGAALNGVDTLNGAAEAINKITTADLKAFVKQVLDQNNYRVYILEPTNIAE